MLSKEAIDRITAPLMDARRNFGLVVGVIDAGETSVFCYGQLDRRSQKPPAANTLFEIASLTKVFTTSLLAVLVAEGSLSLEDKVCDLVPQAAHFPSQISLLSLATHTSGLPMLPFSMFEYLRRGRQNPLADFSNDDLLSFISGYNPKPRPENQLPRQPDYSNVGTGLLGYIIARTLGVTYDEAVIDRICDPLDMHDTRITLSVEQGKRLATPHSPSGKPTSTWEMPGLAGAGALRSTGRDMLKFMAAHLELPQTELTKMIQTSHTLYMEMPALENNWLLSKLSTWASHRLGYVGAGPIGMALGWVVTPLPPADFNLYWHDGLTGGYNAFAGFVKESKTGVVVLVNRAFGEYSLLSPAPTAYTIGYRTLQALNSRSES